MTAGQVESARQRLDAGKPPQEVARNLEVSVPTRYRWRAAGGGNTPDGDPCGYRITRYRALWT